jgi:type I restriction enzyme S subunit
MKVGWQSKPLEAMCEMVTDGSHFSPKTSAEGYPYITVRDIKDGSIDFQNCAFIDKLSYNELCRNGCNPKLGDVLFSKDGTVGKVALVESTNQFVVLSSLAIVRPKVEHIDSKYLSYVLRSPSFLATAIGQKTGVAIRRIILKNLKSILIPVPPLPEQRRIVAILDEAFNGIAIAKANAERNLQNARAIFESHLQSVFTPCGEEWNSKTFSACFRLRSGDGLTSKTMKAGNYPVYGGNGIAGMHDEFNLSGDNVIVGRVGALCGNARRVNEKIWLTDNAFKIVDYRYEFDCEFLVYLLNFKNLRELARQAAQPVISNSSLKDLVLEFPGLREQKNIVINLNALSDEVQRLEVTYRRKMESLSDLKKSLLHQAFSGQL